MDIEQLCYLIARLVGWKSPSQEWLEKYHGIPKERYENLDKNYSPILYKDDENVGELILYPDTMVDHITGWEFLMDVIYAIERFGMHPKEEGLMYSITIDANSVSAGLNKMGARREGIAETSIEGEVDKRMATILTIAKWINTVKKDD